MEHLETGMDNGAILGVNRSGVDVDAFAGGALAALESLALFSSALNADPPPILPMPRLRLPIVLSKGGGKRLGNQGPAGTRKRRHQRDPPQAKPESVYKSPGSGAVCLFVCDG